MQHYETLFVYHPNLGESQVREANDRIRRLLEGLGAEVSNLQEWGSRELAYPIQKQTRGFYVLVQYGAGPGVVKELERNLKIADDVLRFVSVRLAHELVASAERPAQLAAEPTTMSTSMREG